MNLEANANTQVKINKGSILIYRLFDIAEEINIKKVEAILRNNQGPDQFKVPKFIDRGIVVKSRPVSFGLGEEIISVKDHEVRASVLVKIRDFGVLSLIYQINIPNGMSWDAIVKLASDLEEGSEIDQLAEQQCIEISSTIATALTKPNEWDSFEDYIIYFFEEVEGVVKPRELIDKVDISSLIIAEDKLKISSNLKNAVLESLYQYSDNDMAILDWNAAIVFEPTGGREVPDILEFAIAHLLEMRFYDDLLDKRLSELYVDLEKKRTNILSTRFEKSYQDASTRYIEFSEFIERVENSLKVVGDFYLAIIYRAAMRKFRISDWKESVARKMNMLSQILNMLQGEINARRSQILEITIVILILFEIVSAIVK